MHLRIIPIFVLVLVTVFAVSGGLAEPIIGDAFGSLMAAQDTMLQQELGSLLRAEGCYACGPLDPWFDSDTTFYAWFRTTRLICVDRAAVMRAAEALSNHQYHNNSPVSVGTAFVVPLYMPSSFRFYSNVLNGEKSDGQTAPWNADIQLCTVQQNRYLIWLHRVASDGWFLENKSYRTKYEAAVYQYLMSLDADSVHRPPVATEFDLPALFDLYAEPPDYVIQGYQNYKDFLHAHAELTTEFASGITAFVPTVRTLEWMKENAPREAFPNKEAAKLQEEYSKFFRRGGDPGVLQTLTRAGFDGLQSGEYFFAVGLNGTIRFGRELLREEVDRIEKETGRKVPRANHAFLFPGEPLLTAGAFFIDERAEQKLVKVNAQSGHYFYSNIAETIRDDIATRSDHYLLTLGHFFIALDRLGIEYEGILISKL
ncbi:MAG: hypothetical protein OEV49_06715 [candidate division Zixibacteria bacterium]|nr:hypothetical protein [candidate division Zixibacteria bacterium]MDH3938804.1 hypothetical protein [candidate division Zixibacteria bacterium]MDH4032266.1 hypothetical protein [candidate division Zixibacteria bacterium]